MVDIRARCVLRGLEFSPRKFQEISGVRLSRVNEPGSIGVQGRYWNKPIPYGSGDIEVSAEAERDWSKLDELLILVTECIDHARACGAERIVLQCGFFHDGQCEFTFSVAQLKLIAGLRIPTVISAVPYLEEDECSEAK